MPSELPTGTVTLVSNEYFVAAPIGCHVADPAAASPWARWRAWPASARLHNEWWVLFGLAAIARRC